MISPHTKGILVAVATCMVAICIFDSFLVVACGKRVGFTAFIIGTIFLGVLACRELKRKK